MRAKKLGDGQPTSKESSRRTSGREHSAMHSHHGRRQNGDPAKKQDEPRDNQTSRRPEPDVNLNLRLFENNSSHVELTT